ncbi:titin [Leptidea sinapis]|uniref:titin n=1 Tax=Leptidea sinapis TaxID=189913 RepID=UPI0021C299C8|nr:titin [Leptidea sinapis]
MEQETCNKYSIQTDVNSKTYFHCNYSNININKSKVIYLCPSLILAQAFTKGIQVHFYKTHHKHCTVEYKLSSKFRKYSITNILSLSHASGIDDDLYLHFKKLMESIILDAAKINIDGLKVLTCQALEMMTVLSCYDEDHDDIPSPMPVVKKSMTDSQITEELEGTKKTTKRAAMKEPQKIVKRLKCSEDESLSPKIVNSFSLSEKIFENPLMEIGSIKNESLYEVSPAAHPKDPSEPAAVSNGTPKDKEKQKNKWTEPSITFNDTYKDFVIKNFESKKPKKETLKTKIGQFKPYNRSPEKLRSNLQITDKVTKHDQFVATVVGTALPQSLYDNIKIKEQPPVASPVKHMSKRTSIEKPKGKSIVEPRGTPIEITKGTLIDKPRGTPLEKPKFTTLEKPKSTTIDKSGGTPIEKPKGTPIDKPRGTPIEKPKGTPIDKPKGSPIEKPKGTPIDKAGGTPIDKPSGAPIEKPKGTPIEKLKRTPIAKPKSTPTDKSKGTPTDNSKGTPTDKFKSTPLNKPKGTPIYKKPKSTPTENKQPMKAMDMNRSKEINMQKVGREIILLNKLDEEFMNIVEDAKVEKTPEVIKSKKAKLNSMEKKPKIIKTKPIQNKKIIHKSKVVKMKPKPMIKTSNLNTKKKDFEYEVIEQESDCNILVLKL